VSRWTKLGLSFFVGLVLLSLIGAQVISYNSNRTAQEVIRTKDEQIENKNQQIEAIRQSRDRSSAAFRQAAEEKIEITCPLFDRLNEFVTVTARLFVSADLTEEQRKTLVPFLEQSERPPICPDKPKE
jgi:type VI protein secretion system component VasK